MPHELVSKVGTACQNMEEREVEAQWRDLVAEVKASGSWEAFRAACCFGRSTTSRQVTRIGKQLSTAQKSFTTWRLSLIFYLGPGLRHEVECAL